MELDATDPRLGAVATPSRPREHALVEGQSFGAYEIERRVGSGGMGHVYLARDPRLERAVAIKVLNPDSSGESGPAARQRLTREALALAKLSHPNILTVFEIGTVDEVSFIATEYVEGGTLRAWLGKPRATAAIRDLFAQAARGLAAAHRAGLVHRDFKPENVLIDAHGRVRVADFGLVTGKGLVKPEGGGDLTWGALGTPAYMAPEQHDFQKVDARSDQYAFCVALHEALLGERLFTGEVKEIAARKRAGGLELPPRVPARLRAAVARGLSPDPEKRHASMDALVAALEHDPRLARRRALALLGTAVVAGGVALGAQRLAAPDEACRGAEDRLAGVWDTPTQDLVRQAFAASGAANAGDTFTRVAAELDRYAASWAAMHREACAATAIRREQSATVLDARMACLDARRRDLEALTEVMAGGVDVATVNRAVVAAHGLPAIEACADSAALLARVPLPADAGTRLAVAALRARLAGLRARIELGQAKPWLPVAHALAGEAHALKAPAALAETLFALAAVQRDGGERDAVIDTLEDALRTAAEARDDLLTARIAVELHWHFVANLQRWNDAGLLEPGAEVAVTRAGSPPKLRADLLRARAVVAGNTGKAAVAREHIMAALALMANVEDGDYERAVLYNDLTIWLRKEGKLTEAARAGEQSLALHEKLLGPDNPQCGLALNNLANVATDAADYERSERYLRRSLAILEKAYGPDHQQVGRTLNNLGSVLNERGQYAEALAIDRRTVALQEKAVGPDHPELANTLTNLGNLQRTMGDWAGARASQERALAIFAKASDTRTAWAQHYLGEIARDEGDLDRARTLEEQARDSFVKSRGPTHAFVAMTIGELARVELDAGHLDAAEADARRALELRVGGNNPSEHAMALSLAGEVLDARGKHDEALARHNEAVAQMERSVPTGNFELADPLTSLGLSLLAAGRAEDAVAPLERAAALRGDDRGGPVAVARTRLALAKALAASRKDPARALSLARAAQALLAPLGKGAARPRAEVEAWLARR